MNLTPHWVQIPVIHIYHLLIISPVIFKEKWGGNVFSVKQEMDFNMDMSVAHTVMVPVCLHDSHDISSESRLGVEINIPPYIAEWCRVLI